MPDIQKVGIIGAGLSGLMAGRMFEGEGVKVTLFDKARRPGGRANTREHGPYRFDHGAQFFTVRDPLVHSHLDTWIREGVVAEWTGSLVRIKGGTVEPASDAVRYVGVPGMIGLPTHLARDLKVRTDTRVGRLCRESPGWTLYAEDDSKLGSFEAVLVALPAPQAKDLLAHAPGMQSQIQKVEMAPCWAGMYVFEEPLALEFEGAFLSGEPLSWVARDSSKPDRPGVEAWVFHAGPEWTRENLSMDRDEAAKALLREFQSLFGVVPKVVFQRAHRWAYALASDPARHGALFDGNLGIGACGDWCMGGRVEGALLSGMAMAHQVLAFLKGGENHEG
jgi:predicted NAD/FAD-dependent oxidoreductase